MLVCDVMFDDDSESQGLVRSDQERLTEVLSRMLVCAVMFDNESESQGLVRSDQER